MLHLALVERETSGLRVQHAQRVACRLGDELGCVQRFLAEHGVVLGDIDTLGVVVGPGSAGALRSTLSMVGAWAIGTGIEVNEVRCNDETWELGSAHHSYILPVYTGPAHTTPSRKDALGRKLSV